MDGSPETDPGRSPGLLLVLGLGAVGLLARLVPLFPTERMMQQFPTEDGFMMLTVSRNIALGHGMSTSGGTIATNGVQPLATYLYALGYLPFDGDKTAGVAVALAIQIILGMVTAALLYTLGKRVCGDDPRGRLTAGAATALWFAGARPLAHSMNCLESGLYALFVVWGTLIFWDGAKQPPWNVRKCIGAGVVLGGVFWARNDGIFFILAACLWYVYAGRAEGWPGLLPRFRRALIFGCTSVVVASPWMVSNYIGFGHIMPVSGQSEGLYARFGGNLAHLPAAVWEALVPLLPVPEPLELVPAMLVLMTVVIAGLLVWTARAYSHMTAPVQGLVAHTLLFAVCLGSFYGLYFGAAHFMGRYLFPASPLLVLISTAGAAHVIDHSRLLTKGRAMVAASVLVALAAGVQVRAYRLALPHQHAAVVNWVQDNVPEDTWVAAIQTGTLGYYHDRTINLDGKVNPEALAARRGGMQNLYELVVRDQRIEYLVDWAGLQVWYDKHQILRDHFEVIVMDPQANLGVLRRRDVE